MITTWDACFLSNSRRTLQLVSPIRRRESVRFGPYIATLTNVTWNNVPSDQLLLFNLISNVSELKDIESWAIYLCPYYKSHSNCSLLRIAVLTGQPHSKWHVVGEHWIKCKKSLEVERICICFVLQNVFFLSWCLFLPKQDQLFLLFCLLPKVGRPTG